METPRRSRHPLTRAAVCPSWPPFPTQASLCRPGQDVPVRTERRQQNLIVLPARSLPWRSSTRPQRFRVTASAPTWQAAGARTPGAGASRVCPSQPRPCSPPWSRSGGAPPHAVRRPGAPEPPGRTATAAPAVQRLRGGLPARCQQHRAVHAGAGQAAAVGGRRRSVLPCRGVAGRILPLSTSQTWTTPSVPLAAAASRRLNADSVTTGDRPVDSCRPSTVAPTRG